ncbi:MAG: hypothetical protein ACRCZD_04235 [Phycicoccus sp.]
MRTTVDLPSRTHRRARDLAERRGRSLSSVLAELVQRGLDDADDEARPFDLHPDTGLPQIDVGRPVTHDDVQAFLNDDE